MTRAPIVAALAWLCATAFAQQVPPPPSPPPPAPAAATPAPPTPEPPGEEDAPAEAPAATTRAAPEPPQEEPAPAARPEPQEGGVPDEAAPADPRLQMPGIVRFRADEQSATENELRLSGYVDIEMGEARILADQVVYRRAEGTVEATGNVVLSFTGAVLAGSRVVYRVESQTGEVEDAVAYLQRDNAILRARRIERVAKDRLRAEDAEFTACTQPVPYWSFHLTSGTFDLNEYAYLKNVAFRAGHVPLFWSPYLVWPIKEGRAAGLLFPQFGNSTQLGTHIGIPFYWPFAPNADLTLTLTGYTKVGLGLTAELEWLPTYSGWSRGRLNWINDQIRDENRYLLDWSQSQPLGWETHLTANIELVSDFDYFTQYETDLMLASSPQTDSIVELNRSWSWYSLSGRVRRYQQYFVDSAGLLTSEAINDTLPQFELRGRSQRLGRTPFHLSFESSVSVFRRTILVPEPGLIGAPSEDQLYAVVDDTWTRADLAPQLQIPLVKAAWGDLTLNGAWRGTYWSGRRDPTNVNAVTQDTLYRNLWNAGFVFNGPRVQRVFDTPRWNFSPKLKHVLEPFLDYRWRPASGVDPEDIPFFDQIDAVPGELSAASYGLRQRFLALRRPDTANRPTLASARETSLEAVDEEAAQAERSVRENGGREAAEEALAVDSSFGPVEIASLEIAQAYTFNASSGAADRKSPWRVRLRINPTAEKTLDASAVLDADTGTPLETSISGLIRLSDRAFAQGSWFNRREGTKTDFLRTRWEFTSPSRRFGLATEWDWNADTDKLEHQRYQVRVLTQCCSFRLGYDRRDFVNNFRQEFSLVVDLTGLGEILDLVRAD